jgi:endonuclease/exonuclease/phosphatase family metal-dependent hydrolase
VRFMTYNIKHGQGADLALSNRRIADAVREADPAVAGLNEVWQRAGSFEQTREIAGLLGMEYRFLEAHRRGRMSIGNAVLTRGRILDSSAITLEKQWEGRGALIATIEVDGVEVVFVSTHLSLHAETRGRQIEQLLRELPLERPLVLTGDFNAGAEELAPLKAIMEVVDEPPRTYPSPLPMRALDHIAFSRHWRLTSLTAPPGIASDHRPLVADLELVQAKREGAS